MKKSINISIFQEQPILNENLSQLKPLQSAVEFSIISTQSQKTTVEPANSFIFTLANSTPKACFFVRSFRTPKESAFLKKQGRNSLSMVAFNGKGSPFVVFQCRRFCSLLNVTAQTLQSLAVAFNQIYIGAKAMFYLFQGITRQDFSNTCLPVMSLPKVRLCVQADNENQARAQLAKDYFLILIGQINPKNFIKNTPHFVQVLQAGNQNNSSSSNEWMNSFHFTKAPKADYSNSAIAKSIAERGNSNNLYQANTSTPFNYRAIFVCSLRTPKENQSAQNCADYFLSMIACDGQRLIVGCLPDMAVFHPVTSYRQIVESLAIALNIKYQELSQMLFKFLLLGENRLRISIRATSEQQARAQLNLNRNNSVFIARINTAVKGGANG